MKFCLRLFPAILALICLLMLGSCTDSTTPKNDGEVLIDLSADISTDKAEAVYASNDIIYYEDRDTYDSGNMYGEGEADERHSTEKASAHTVVNIAKPGTYRLMGELKLGQVRVDLGENAKTDPAAVVTLILDGASVNCEVAPAILFKSVYECDNAWSTDTATSEVDTSTAGARVIIADGSINNVSGSHVAKIFKDNEDEKKLWKQDGAFYSYMSMNIDGEENGSGILNINADNEGMNSELHLTINGGIINIRSKDDGINTNEDGVSVTTINGGNIHIIAGLGVEGDGVDSNGWLVINGGTVIAAANPVSDSGLDSDMGSYVNGGTVIALGSTMDWAESDSDAVTVNLQFADYKSSDSAIIFTDTENKVVFAYDPTRDEVIGENIRRYSGAVISSPDFNVGDSYLVYIGGTVDGEEYNGVYDISTVTGFEGAAMQSYTGTDVRRGPGGHFGGGMKPGKGDRGDIPFEPHDFEGEVPTMPEGGFGKGERPTPPEGERPDMPKPEFNSKPVDMPKPDNIPVGDIPVEDVMAFPIVPDGEVPADANNTLFYMQDKVNFFSGVADF